MSPISRKQFLGLGALAVGAALAEGPSWADAAQATAPPAPSPAAGLAPDLVVLNARVYTVDPAQPRAEAFAVKHGRFVAVGGTADVKNLVARGTQVICAASRPSRRPCPSGVAEGERRNPRWHRVLRPGRRQPDVCVGGDDEAGRKRGGTGGVHGVGVLRA